MLLCWHAWPTRLTWSTHGAASNQTLNRSKTGDTSYSHLADARIIDVLGLQRIDILSYVQWTMPITGKPGGKRGFNHTSADAQVIVVLERQRVDMLFCAVDNADQWQPW